MFRKNLDKKIDKLNKNFEKSNIEELAYILGNKKEIAKRNFLAGILRGIGIGIGFTLITGIILIILQRIVMLNIPVIGNYLGDLLHIIEKTR